MTDGRRKAKREFHINGIRRINEDGISRLECDLEVRRQGKEGVRTESRTLTYEAPEEYGRYLVWERCDAFVVLMLHTALKKGFDISSDVPMSSDLRHNLVEGLLPPLVKNGGHDISLDIGIAPPLPAGNGAGTGLSCGVDSLHTIHKYMEYPAEDFRLTHLCINDVGAFGNHLYWRIGEEKVRENSYARARKAAEEIGLPLIETRSNVAHAMHLDHVFTHSFSSAFATMCMKKLWRRYYYASAGVDFVSDFTLKGWLDKKPATYEPLLLREISTPGLTFYSAGEIESRLDKMAEIADYGVARRHLYSCTWDLENCGVCRKCIRNLTSLDALGKLQNFSEVFDLGHYEAHREYHLWKVYEGKDDWFFKEVYERLMERKDPLMAEIDRMGAAVERFDLLWKNDDPEDDKKAVKAVKPYLGLAAAPALRMAKAYKYGRGVPKSRAKYMECLDLCRRQYQEEVDAGF